MVKHTQTICRQKMTNSLRVFDHFVGLALKGLSCIRKHSSNLIYYRFEKLLLGLLGGPEQNNLILLKI